MPQISKRALATTVSPIRKYIPLILEAEKKGVKVFKLNMGDPDIPAPTEFLETIKSYSPEQIPYSPSTGLPKHILAWQKYYQTLGIKLKTNQILPTAGCSEAIMYSLMAITDPGDEILVFEPFYPSYKSFAAMLGIKLKAITLTAKNNYALPTGKKIETSITKKTKAILITNPNNPTGTVMNKKELMIILGIAKKYNLFIISDETYRDIIFSGSPISILQIPATGPKAIVVDSASKRFSLPGVRIGCVASHNKEVMSTILKFCLARLAAPTLGQIGLIRLLKNHQPYVKKITTEYKKRRDIVITELKKIPGVTYVAPSGAFYMIVELPVKNAEDFVIFMLKKFHYNKKTVALSPLNGFYQTKNLGKKEIRIAYVLNQKDLKESITLLAKGLKLYKTFQ